MNIEHLLSEIAGSGPRDRFAWEKLRDVCQQIAGSIHQLEELANANLAKLDGEAPQ